MLERGAPPALFATRSLATECITLFIRFGGYMVSIVAECDQGMRLLDVKFVGSCEDNLCNGRLLS